MNFLVNASPKPLDIAPLTTHVRRSHDVEGTGLHFV